MILPGDSFLPASRARIRIVRESYFRQLARAPGRDCLAWSGQLSSPSTLKPAPRGEPLMDKPFLTDIKELRRRARSHIEEGAVTEGYRADRDTVLRLLNEALATE